ncbi:dihydroorotate dehydrogenase [Neobacillus sp. 19]|uniref:dihydroorotate dehydrogenase n=1 Tax=Neobacillus sp. 19 TaxID=3394458 RepID=UPI003BF740B5
MPDWSYHTLFKPVVTRLPNAAGREFIHRGMNWIASLPGGGHFIEFIGHMAHSPALSKSIMGLTFSNPVGLSGKIDPFLSGTTAFSNLGFGFIEIGPIAPASVRPAHYSVKDDEILFPVSLESLGMEQTLQKLAALKPLCQPLFIRMSQDLAFEELLTALPSLTPYGDAFVLEKQYTTGEIKTIKDLLGNKPLLLSIQQSSVPSMIYTINEFDGIVLEENSKITGSARRFPPKQTNDFISSLRMLKSNGFAKPLIISGGVLEPEDALSLLEEGAELIMLSSGYVLSGPGLPKRINEALVDQLDEQPVKLAGWIWYWLFGLFITLGGLLALLFSMTSVILPYDEAFLGFTREEIMAINPNVIYFMAHDRMTLAGTMISGGILYMMLARYGVRYGLHWARRAINLAAIIGFFGILLFIGYGYFDWLHAIFWLILLPVFIIGFRKTKDAVGTPRSKNRTNDSAWKKSLWGQLCFVILGFSFILGGLVIASIGVTNVFVPTDVDFICLTPEQMNDINSRLIPLIAHDRAGFGGALISVGLLVLTVSLWGFHQGEKWIWYTLLIAGIPAFCAGILTHFFIGYTTFIHLLPAYFALFLYVMGLVLSRGFFVGLGHNR